MDLQQASQMYGMLLSRVATNYIQSQGDSAPMQEALSLARELVRIGPIDARRGGHIAGQAAILLRAAEVLQEAGMLSLATPGFELAARATRGHDDHAEARLVERACLGYATIDRGDLVFRVINAHAHLAESPDGQARIATLISIRQTLKGNERLAIRSLGPHVAPERVLHPDIRGRVALAAAFGLYRAGRTAEAELQLQTHLRTSADERLRAAMHLFGLWCCEPASPDPEDVLKSLHATAHFPHLGALYAGVILAARLSAVHRPLAEIVRVATGDLHGHWLRGNLYAIAAGLTREGREGGEYAYRASREFRLSGIGGDALRRQMIRARTYGERLAIARAGGTRRSRRA